MTKYIYRIVPQNTTPISYTVEKAAHVPDLDNCHRGWRRVEGQTYLDKDAAERYIDFRLEVKKTLEDFLKNNPPYIYPPE
jgi:hypothetical protein